MKWMWSRLRKRCQNCPWRGRSGSRGPGSKPRREPGSSPAALITPASACHFPLSTWRISRIWRESNTCSSTSTRAFASLRTSSAGTTPPGAEPAGMKVALFGASGMIGQGVLRECLLAPDVEAVLVVGRSGIGVHHTKLRQVMRSDLSNYEGLEPELSGLDGCFFCLGVSSSGMSEAEYERITYGITLAAAGVLSRLNPDMTFVYVSGAGTDSSEKGRIMWARVKGRT